MAGSFTPYTPETIEVAAEVAERGVPVVAITASPFSPLTRSARSWIEVVESDYGAFRSLTPTITLALALAVSFAELRPAGKPGWGGPPPRTDHPVSHGGGIFFSFSKP